jgi:hypothetical protein
MKFAVKLALIAVLATMTGIAFASPLLYTSLDIKPFPRVPEGPKADFSVNVVYASFNPVDWQYTTTVWDEAGTPSNKTYPATNVTYNVVLNVTNLSDQPATVYEFAFTAAQGISVKQSILGGTIYDGGAAAQSSVFPYNYFGSFVEGVYLNKKWVNATWMPNVYTDINGTSTIVPYPYCLNNLTETTYYGGFMGGPLTPDNIRAYSADHKVNGTVPELPANASETGIWFGGVPIAEYYDSYGNPLITEMYINGSWVDVTGKVTVDNTQPMITATNTLESSVMTVGAQPYENENASLGAITTLPQWGDWNVGRGYSWFPWDWNRTGFNNTWAPHESRLIMFNNTAMCIFMSPTDAPSSGLAALESGSMTFYASASNYINNAPVNGTYYNTVSTATQVIQLHLDKTPNGYVYNAILADDQTFQPGNSSIEVTIAPRTQP